MTNEESLKVAIVTGGAAGIGLACAQRLAARGYAIGLADLPGSALAAAASGLEAAQAQVLALPGDVSDAADVQEQCRKLIERYGRIDVLVNNAGVSQAKGLLDISEQEWDRTIDVNLKGVFNWSKAVAPHMLTQRRGRIINMSSISAYTGGSAAAVSKFAYCASKAGILGLTRGLAKELAPHVMVNAVCPGLIQTGLTDALIESRAEQLKNAIPLGRVGTAVDIAVVVEFLATVNPCFITGAAIDVNGGQ